MSINYELLREYIENIPEVKRLLEERKKIEKDSRKKGTYKKPAPKLTPSNDKFHHKLHSYNNSENKAFQNANKKELKENAKKIEKAIQDDCKKKELPEYSKSCNEMTSDELVVFIKKGHEQVLQNRKVKKTEIELNKTQEKFDVEIEVAKKNKKEPVRNKFEETNERIQKAYDRMRVERERELRENKKDIEQGRGFSR